MCRVCGQPVHPWNWIPVPIDPFRDDPGYIHEVCPHCGEMHRRAAPVIGPCRFDLNDAIWQDVQERPCGRPGVPYVSGMGTTEYLCRPHLTDVMTWPSDRAWFALCYGV